MRGICIDTGSSTVLQEGKEYYLFEHGPNYYVSKFNKPNSHMGSFRKSLFKLVEKNEPQPQEPKYHIGEVAYPRMGWRLGQQFIIGPTKHPELEGKGYYNVHLADNGSIIATMNDPRLFKIIEPCKLPQKPVKFERKQVANTNTPDKPQKAESKQENKHKKAQYEQMSIFDF